MTSLRGHGVHVCSWSVGVQKLLLIQERKYKHATLLLQARNAKIMRRQLADCKDTRKRQLLATSINAQRAPPRERL